MHTGAMRLIAPVTAASATMCLAFNVTPHVDPLIICPMSGIVVPPVGDENQHGTR